LEFRNYAHDRRLQTEMFWEDGTQTTSHPALQIVQSESLDH
jgi:hypothetical protein